MNWGSAMIWAFFCTIIFSAFVAACRGMRLSRLDFPFLIGTMFTQNRDRARTIGFFVHFFNGWVFSIMYYLGFLITGFTTVWFGMLIGVVHSLFLLSAGMYLLPSIHPRMANEHSGPNTKRILEPPGFLALNYGPQTPIVTVVAHMIFGATLSMYFSF